MDIFGIGSAIKATIGMYLVVSRGTGRTITMINSLKPGDRIIFSNSTEAYRVKKLCKERDIENIRFEVVHPKDCDRLYERGSSQGRTIFDHSWVEEFYQNVIDRAEKDIDYFQKGDCLM